MEIVAKEPIKYTAEAITIRGKLKLNNEDINQLMYSMVDVIKVD